MQHGYGPPVTLHGPHVLRARMAARDNGPWPIKTRVDCTHWLIGKKKMTWSGGWLVGWEVKKINRGSGRSGKHRNTWIREGGGGGEG